MITVQIKLSHDNTCVRRNTQNTGKLGTGLRILSGGGGNTEPHLTDTPYVEEAELRGLRWMTHPFVHSVK